MSNLSHEANKFPSLVCCESFQHQAAVFDLYSAQSLC